MANTIKNLRFIDNCQLTRQKNIAGIQLVFDLDNSQLKIHLKCKKNL